MKRKVKYIAKHCDTCDKITRMEGEPRYCGFCSHKFSDFYFSKIDCKVSCSFSNDIYQLVDNKTKCQFELYPKKFISKKIK